MVNYRKYNSQYVTVNFFGCSMNEMNENLCYKNEGIYTTGSNRQQQLMNTLLKPRKGRCYQALSYYQCSDIRNKPAVCFSPY